MRRAWPLVILVVAAAVLVPTAVLSGPSRSGQAFSVQQVLRVFEAEGIPLQRETGLSPTEPEESFSGDSLNVTVYRPGAFPPRQQGFGFVALGYQLPQATHRGNVYVSMPRPASSGRWSRVLAALRALRYSRADASRPQLPTIVLRPGDRLMLTARQAPIGSEVDCTNGSVSEGPIPQPVDASIGIDAVTRRSSAYSASAYTTRKGKAMGAKLQWTPEGRGSLAFACSGWMPAKRPAAGSAYFAEGEAGMTPQFPATAGPATPGPLPPLKLARPTFTLGNEYAGVPAKTRRAMLGSP